MMERFWARVIKGPEPDDCWEWTGARTAAGYGELMVGGRMWYAHRLSLHLNGSPVPDGMVADHLCRNRACVRPDHLRATSHRENILSGTGASARNAVKGVCPSGHPYDDANTWRNRHGARFCRACRQAYDARNRERDHARARARYQERRGALAGGV